MWECMIGLLTILCLSLTCPVLLHTLKAVTVFDLFFYFVAVVANLCIVNSKDKYS